EELRVLEAEAEDVLPRAGQPVGLVALAKGLLHRHQRLLPDLRLLPAVLDRDPDYGSAAGAGHPLEEPEPFVEVVGDAQIAVADFDRAGVELTKDARQRHQLLVAGQAAGAAATVL